MGYLLSSFLSKNSPAYDHDHASFLSKPSDEYCRREVEPGFPATAFAHPGCFGKGRAYNSFTLRIAHCNSNRMYRLQKGWIQITWIDISSLQFYSFWPQMMVSFLQNLPTFAEARTQCTSLPGGTGITYVARAYSYRPI
jgi:hypothetical protein